MTVWKQVGDRSLRALHINTLSGKFVLFTVAATLLTTLLMSLLAPGGSGGSSGDRVGLELRAVSSDVAREMGAWVDQRVFDLRLRATPYVVSDNLARATGGSRSAAQALVRLRDYVNSIRQNLPAHEGLAIVGLDGQVLTYSGTRTGLRLSQDHLNDLRARDALVGDAVWDAVVNKPVIVLVVPIRRDDGFLLGALSAKVNLNGLMDTLRDQAAGHRLYIITEQGRMVISSGGSSADLMKTTLPAATMRELLEHEGQTVTQSRPQGGDVIAVLRPVPQLRWAAVAETPVAEAAARDAAPSRARTVLLVIALVLVVGLLGFIMSVLTTRPLALLSEAAARVAAGDLSTELPPAGSGEVGYLTRAFTTLVTRLREKEGQSELERLSLTDALTGLYNRRHLMGTLASEVQRSRRLRRSFSIVIADVDHFKQYNDTHGHLAGDGALVKIAEVLRKTTRAVDCVARYGGEEFVVMLLECPLATAQIVAERIRASIAEQDLGHGPLTVSIGVTEYPDGGDTPEELIATADAAMYQAKNAGRNQIVVARTPQTHVPERRSGRKKRA